jgi:uncharacterized protein (TIGR00297 family)
MLIRLIVSAAVALAVSLIAARARALTPSGAAAAAVIGTCALLAGWNWALLLIVYFASASALSSFRADEKHARSAAVVEKGGDRDAMQVIANGGVFALAAVVAAIAPVQTVRCSALAVGALAASASDTWATEIGLLVGGTPRSILGFGPVQPGMSGGVTIAGSLAALAGAAFVPLVAALLGWSPSIALGAFGGGVVGSTLDSLLGATLQSRRWCPQCERATERIVHDCGTPTRAGRGLAWFDNDVVNILCGIAGGLFALAMSG